MHDYARTAARALVVVALTSTAPGAANAGLIAFSGTQMNIDSATAAPAARCGPRVTVRIGNGPDSSSTATSNLGSFLATLSHCIAPPPPTTYDLGEFVYDFADGSTLFGTYDGTLSLGMAPGVFANLQHFQVTGGSGFFTGASGAFTGIGTVDFTGLTPRASLTFNGVLDVPGVPEPSQWAFLIAGFGLAGGAMRRAVARDSALRPERA